MNTLDKIQSVGRGTRKVPKLFSIKVPDYKNASFVEHSESFSYWMKKLNEMGVDTPLKRMDLAMLLALQSERIAELERNEIVLTATVEDLRSELRPEGDPRNTARPVGYDSFGAVYPGD